MSLFLNILWVLFGGFFMGVAWFLYGIIAAITIVGLPWARACFNIGWFVIWPFGRQAVNRQLVTGEEDIGIPFGYQHIKFIEISMLPIGKTIVEID